MTRIAHISDTHFGTERPFVCAALRGDLLDMAPALVVLTGDITQRARRAQFRSARSFLDSLAPLPVLAVPGNHDLPLFDLLTRFLDPYGHYRAAISTELAPAWEEGEVAVLGVDSTRRLRHKHGVLPGGLVEALAGRLAGLSQSFKIVALHHPLAVIARRDQRNRARGAEAALAAWTRAGADLVLGGHIHLPYCIEVGPAERRALLLQAGTAVSWRCRAGQPNSYNLVHFQAGSGRSMAIEQRDYDQEADRFVTVVRHEADFGASGWRLRPAA